MQKFDISRLSGPVDQPARDAMLEVILAFARLDTIISRWMAAAFGTAPEATVILMGTMTTKNKLDRLKALYLHFQMPDQASRVGFLQNELAKHVDVRNTIAHVACTGLIADAPGMIAFSAIKRVKNASGYTFIEVLSLSQMNAATAFAYAACDDLIAIIDQIEGRSSPHSD